MPVAPKRQKRPKAKKAARASDEQPVKPKRRKQAKAKSEEPVQVDPVAVEPSPVIVTATTVPTPIAAPVPQIVTPPDPFDPARLRLSQDFASSLGVRKALLTVPVKKPAREWFVQVHPDETYQIQTCVLELKEDRETYLVDPELWPELSTTEATFSPRALFTAINRQGVLFIWPVRLPGADGKLDDWSRSALEAADAAKSKWVRVSANMSLGAYDVWEASSDLPGPVWPQLPFQELLRTAFKDRHITSLDHPVLKRLRGEV